MTSSSLLALAVPAREFLVQRWEAWHADQHRLAHAHGHQYLIPRISSANMSRPTAAFMAIYLRRRTELPWTVRAGIASPSNAAGLRDPAGVWHTHFWTVAGNSLITLTADQHGYGPIVASSVGDGRFSQSVRRADMPKQLRDVQALVAQWLREAAEAGVL